MLILSNAFSLQMIESFPVSMDATELSLEQAREKVAKGFKSSVGHQDIANVLSDMLGTKVEMNRCSDKLQPGDELLVGQFMGGRLPEGCTTLPEGFSIKFVLVTF